jgi:hypothetical protein
LRKVFPTGAIFVNLGLNPPTSNIRNPMSPSKSAKDIGATAGGETKALAPETRRRFLRVSGAGIVGITLGGGSRASATENVVDNDPNYTGLEVSAIDPADSLSVCTGPNTTEWLDVGDDLANGAVLNVAPNSEFELETENTNNDAVDYDTSGDDCLEIDMTAIEAFEEDYDPDANGTFGNPEDCPYIVTDEDGTIGING